jgi:hypothetical protein
MARFTHPANDGSGISAVLPFHGSFYSSVDQTLAINTPGAMQFENTDLSQGISIANDTFGYPTLIRIQNLGVYNIQFSAQFHNTGGGGAGSTVDIWMVHQGNAVADTNTKIEVPSNAPYVVASWNFFVTSDTVPQDFQIFWKTPKAEIKLEHILANGVIPATPSIILTVNQVA